MPVQPVREQDDLWLAKPVPRYTSYPPATAFHAEVGPEAYGAFLKGLQPDLPVSLYVHIPFCRHLCRYCGCHTYATDREDRIAAYQVALEQEIRLVAAKVGHPLKISHLHFGGGSPNRLSPESFVGLVKNLRRSFDFSACREVAVEIDPRLVNEAQVEALAQSGVTRVSLGVQTFDPAVQEAVGRVQPFEQVQRVCESVRRVGIQAINFDLMYGLPLQTAENVAETARLALALEPSRVALFSYAHVPQMKPHQKALEAYGLPGKYELLDQEAAGRVVWEAAGYLPLGMDHYALPGDPLVAAFETGRMRRNFQGYTDDTAERLLGLGVSALGSGPEGFFQNEKDPEPYQASMARGELATIRGFALSAEDRCRSEVIERLMTYLECDLGAVARRHDFSESFFDMALEGLTPLVAGGLIERQGRRIRLSTPRRMAIRVVAYAFDGYAGRGTVPSSRAV